MVSGGTSSNLFQLAAEDNVTADTPSLLSEIPGLGFGLGATAGPGPLQANANIGLFQVPISLSTLNPTGGAGGAGGGAYDFGSQTGGADSIVTGPIEVGGGGGGGGGASIFGSGQGGASGGPGGGGYNIDETNILAPPPLPNMVPFQTVNFPSGSMATIPNTPYTPPSASGGNAVPGMLPTSGELNGGGPVGPNFLPAVLGGAGQQDGTSGGSPWMVQGPQGNGGSGAPPAQASPTLPEILSGRNLPQVAGTPRGMVGMSPSGSPMLSGNVSAIEQAQADPNSILASNPQKNNGLPPGMQLVPPPPPGTGPVMDGKYGQYQDLTPEAAMAGATNMIKSYIKSKSISNQTRKDRMKEADSDRAEKQLQTDNYYRPQMDTQAAIMQKQRATMDKAQEYMSRYQARLNAIDAMYQQVRPHLIDLHRQQNPFGGIGTFRWKHDLNNPEKTETRNQYEMRTAGEVDAAHDNEVARDWAAKGLATAQSIFNTAKASYDEAQKTYNDLDSERNKQIGEMNKYVTNKFEMGTSLDKTLDEDERSDDRLRLDAVGTVSKIQKDQDELTHKRNLLKQRDDIQNQNAQFKQYAQKLDQAKVALSALKHDDYQSRVKLLDGLAKQNALSNSAKAVAASLMANPRALTNEAVQGLFDMTMRDMSAQVQANNGKLSTLESQLFAGAPPTTDNAGLADKFNSGIQDAIKQGWTPEQIDQRLRQAGFRYDAATKTAVPL